MDSMASFKSRQAMAQESRVAKYSAASFDSVLWPDGLAGGLGGGGHVASSRIGLSVISVLVRTIRSGGSGNSTPHALSVQNRLKVITNGYIL